MANSILKLVAAAFLAAGLLAGCGENPVDTGTGTGSTTYGGTGIPKTTTPTYTTPTTGTGSVYGTVPAAGTTGCGATGTTTGTTQGALPGTSTGTATPAQAGCGQTTPAVGATPVPSGKSGMEAAITAREESGIFSKSLKGVTVAVANHDKLERSRFLLVIFSKKGHEVDVQYKSIRMPAGGTANFSFKASKDADDATVELRDTLL